MQKYAIRSSALGADFSISTMAMKAQNQVQETMTYDVEHGQEGHAGNLTLVAVIAVEEASSTSLLHYMF